MIVDFRRKPPCSPPLAIMNSTVTAVESFRFLGTTISLLQDLKWDNHIESVLCMSITVWFSSATKSDLRRLRRVGRTAERIIGSWFPPPPHTHTQTYTPQESRVSKKAGRIPLDTSHSAHSLFERLVDASELWAPERPDTGTVSSLRQSISWTLDNKHTTLLYNYLFLTHTYF